jgi:C-terminal processing protease CtpA/Prc
MRGSIDVGMLLSLALCGAAPVLSLAAQMSNQTPTLTAAAGLRVVDSVANAIKQKYVFPAIADSTARVIRERAAHGAYTAATSESLATLLTADLRTLSGDRHLALHYEPRSTRETVVDSAERQRRRVKLLHELEATNWGIPEVRVMDGNVGYIALTAIHAPARAGELFTNAMNFLARTDALILDLRANTGGDSDMPNLVLSYFYDEPVQVAEVHHRNPAQVEQDWTFSYVPGKSYRGQRPVYVLMSDSTFSAAEMIAYTLQTTKRATIVGARTKGGANSGYFYPVGNDLVLFVPTTRMLSPLTKANWDGVGIIPDIPVSADDALRVAHDSAVARLRRTP